MSHKRIILTLLVALAGLVGACTGTAETVENLPTGIPLPARAAVPAHQTEVTDLVRSPDGATLATASADTIHIWDAAAMQPIAAIDGVPLIEFHKGLAVADGGAAVAVLTEHFQLFVWEQASGRARSGVVGFGDAPRALVGFAPDGSLFMITADDRLLRWQSGLSPTIDASSLDEGDAIPDAVEHVADLSFYGTSTGLPESRYLVWTTMPFVLGLDPDGRTSTLPLADLQGAYARDHDAPMLADDDQALLRVETGHVERVDRAGAPLGRLEHTGMSVVEDRDDIVASSLSVAGRFLAVGYRSGAVEIWEVASGERVAAFSVAGRFVRPVHDRRIRDLEFTAEHLHVLCPEQRLLHYSAESWTLTGESEL